MFSFVYVLWAWKINSCLKHELWFLRGWLPFSFPYVAFLLLLLPLVYVCGVNLLVLWSLLFRVLWFFVGMSSLYVVVLFVS